MAYKWGVTNLTGMTHFKFGDAYFDPLLNGPNIIST